jgi:hypothetical protein
MSRSAPRRTETDLPAGLDNLVFRPVTPDTRPDFEHLFEAPGGPKYCWCMVWRRTAEEVKENNSAGRRSQMMRRIGEGIPVGLLAYAGDAPVGWCRWRRARPTAISVARPRLMAR